VGGNSRTCMAHQMTASLRHRDRTRCCTHQRAPWPISDAIDRASSETAGSGCGCTVSGAVWVGGLICSGFGGGRAQVMCARWWLRTRGGSGGLPGIYDDENAEGTTVRGWQVDFHFSSTSPPSCPVLDRSPCLDIEHISSSTLRAIVPSRATVFSPSPKPTAAAQHDRPFPSITAAVVAQFFRPVARSG
jgi:hypothetical protein